MIGWFHNPENNKTAVWVATMLFMAPSLLSYLFFPSVLAFFILSSIYAILSSWAWHYSDWVENCLYGQQEETIGNRALLVEARLALAGAASAALIFVVAAVALNQGITWNFMLLICGVLGLATLLSFVDPRIKAFLLGCLKAVCEIPFHVAIIWMAITTDQRLLDARYRSMNKNAKKLFAFITGYESNLSVLHDTQDILRQLPKRG